MIAPDLLGYGDEFHEPILLEAATANSHADRIIELIDTNDIKNPVIAGYDIGSRIAQAIAVKVPDKIGGLVITPGYPGIGDRISVAEVQHLFWYQHFHRLDVAGDSLVEIDPLWQAT